MSRQFSALLVNLPLPLLLLCDRVVASVRSKTSFKAENGCFSCCHFALFSVLGLMDLAVSAATGLRTWLLNAKLLLLLLLTKLLGALSLRECSRFSLSLSPSLSQLPAFIGKCTVANSLLQCVSWSFIAADVALCCYCCGCWWLLPSSFALPLSNLEEKGLAFPNTSLQKVSSQPVSQSGLVQFGLLLPLLPANQTTRNCIPISLTRLSLFSFQFGCFPLFFLFLPLAAVGFDGLLDVGRI